MVIDNTYYGNHARIYDPLTGRFTTIDPLAGKYPSLSPYNHCANNPLNALDPDGRDICVLLHPNGAMGMGHLALLIQNENKTWSLWSKNGSNQNSGFKGESVIGTGEDLDQLGVGNFDTIEDFFRSDLNESDSSDKIKYTKGYIIQTTTENDDVARNAVKSEIDKEYNLFISNCATAVQKALESIGKDPGITRNGILDDPNINKNTIIPNHIFINIVSNNPEGKIINAK